MGTGGTLVVIDFSELGNSAHFRGEGWSGQEADRVWAVGPRCVLRVPIQSSGRSMILEAEIGPNRAPPMITGQIVRVRVDDTPIGGVRFDTRSMIRCEIDGAIVRGNGVLKIEFEFPGFFRPDWLPGSEEHRPLSGWFSFMRLYTTDLFKPGPHFPRSHPDIPLVGLTPPPRESPAPEAPAQTVAYTFGPSGTAVRFLRDGWDAGEDDYTWTVAPCSQLELPAPDSPGPHVLRLDAAPMIVPGKVREQHVTIALDGVAIGQIDAREAAAWIMPLPRELVEGRDNLALGLGLRDAVRPGDLGPSDDMRLLGIAVTRIAVAAASPRLFAVANICGDQGGQLAPIAKSDQFLTEDMAALPTAIEAALGLDVKTLARGFESLGTCQEFGLVQRKLGLEVLNLFRFCDGNLADLVRALTDDLTSIEAPGSLTVEPNHDGQGERVVTWPAYSLRWHRFEAGDEADMEAIVRTFGYLRRKFFEGLRSGRKVYVLQQQQPPQVSQAAALLMELNRHGRATLLCVEPASNGRQPGEVQLLMPGLMRGIVEHAAPGSDVESADPAGWLRVLANAALLHRGAQAVVPA